MLVITPQKMIALIVYFLKIESKIKTQENVYAFLGFMMIEKVLVCLLKKLSH